MKKPEFLINTKLFPGTPLGRLFVPYSFTRKPKFIKWHKSTFTYRVTYYRTGIVIWFFASQEEYKRFAFHYPHHRHANYTLYVLRNASTFFRGLKPPYLNDDEYLC